MAVVLSGMFIGVRALRCTTEKQISIWFSQLALGGLGHPDGESGQDQPHRGRSPSQVSLSGQLLLENHERDRASIRTCRVSHQKQHYSCLFGRNLGSSHNPGTQPENRKSEEANAVRSRLHSAVSKSAATPQDGAPSFTPQETGLHGQSDYAFACQARKLYAR